MKVDHHLLKGEAIFFRIETAQQFDSNVLPSLSLSPYAGIGPVVQDGARAKIHIDIVKTQWIWETVHAIDTFEKGQCITAKAGHATGGTPGMIHMLSQRVQTGPERGLNVTDLS
jgi:hypothetical protein